MKFPGFFRTKGINEEEGKPHIVAFMFDEHEGVSAEGGALGSGVHLTFGDSGLTAFHPEQWEEIE